MNKRKHILLKNEIEAIQLVLQEKVFYTDFYIENLVNRLEELKKEWYKVRKNKLKRGKE